MFLRVLLMIVIIGSAGFSYAKYQSLGSDDSPFNQTTRYELGRFPLVRTLLQLHKDGDARMDLLDSKNELEIIVLHPAGESPDSAITTFATQAERYLGRTVRVTSFATLPSGMLRADALADITRPFRPLHAPSPIVVIFADDFEAEGEEIGQTFEEYAIVVSTDRINELTKSFPSESSRYIASTLLHEFGHQLGLGHVNDPLCIMHDYVESPRGRMSAPDDFCAEELRALEEQRLR